MSNLFKIKVDRPVNSFYEKIILSFLQQSIYFSYHSWRPEYGERAKFDVETAVVSSFLNMIEEELRSAYKLAHDEKPK